MSATTAFLNAAAAGGVSSVSHIALIDDTSIEIDRQATSWASASGGTENLAADIDFDVPAGTTVASWSGFDAASGGTDFGGADLTGESYTNGGTYTLTASSTGYQVQ
ncbi:MAG: hypothetical protein ACRDQA_16080 [Nocardioidaceae bacterium]